MTVSLKIDDKRKIIFSDNNFKHCRKKPTMSVYDAELNVEQKVASFNSQETFEWFLELFEIREAEDEGLD